MFLAHLYRFRCNAATLPSSRTLLFDATPERMNRIKMKSIFGQFVAQFRPKLFLTLMQLQSI